MGFLRKLIPEKDYEHEGVHHVRITDEAFEKAVESFESYTEEDKNMDVDLIKIIDETISDEKSLLEYDSSDFPALEIFSTLFWPIVFKKK